MSLPYILPPMLQPHPHDSLYILTHMLQPHPHDSCYKPHPHDYLAQPTHSSHSSHIATIAPHITLHVSFVFPSTPETEDSCISHMLPHNRPNHPLYIAQNLSPPHTCCWVYKPPLSCMFSHHQIIPLWSHSIFSLTVIRYFPLAQFIRIKEIISYPEYIAQIFLSDNKGLTKLR